MTRLLSAIVIGSFMTTCCLAQTQPPLIPRDVLFGNPDRAQLRISPDGQHLSFLAPVNGVLNVWVAPTNDVSSAKAITHDSKRGIMQYQWAFDNAHILYLQDQGGNENWNIHSVDLEGQNDKNLTPNPKVAARIMQASDQFPTQILVGLNDRVPSFHDVHRIDIVSGQDTLVLANPGMIEGNPVAGFTTDHSFRIRFAAASTPDGGSLAYKPSKPIDAANAKEEIKDVAWTQFLAVPMEDAMTTGAVGLDRSGDIAYFRDSRDRDTAALFAWNLKTDEKKLLAENDKADAGQVITDPKDHHVQAVSFNYERQQWRVIDPAIQPDLDYLKTVSDGDLQIGSRSQDDRFWTVAYTQDAGPAKSYLYDRANRKASFIFTNKKSLEGLPLAKMHPVVIPSRDGLDMVCYYTTPLAVDADQDGKPDHPLPTVLDVHGGPWARDAFGFNPEHQWLANRGYAVISVNYRGSTGFGKKFVNASNKEWAGKMHDDLIDVVNWAVKNKLTDPAKVGIMGASYGGYATLVGMTFTPDTFACGVDVCGPSSLYTLIKSVPPYWKPAIAQFRMRVGDESTTEGKSFLESRSPLSLADRITRPLLIGQGANDPRVKQAEADQIVKAMQTRQIPVTYVLYPDEGHGFARPENRTSFYAVAEAFLAKHLGGRFEPTGDDFKGSSIQIKSGADQVPGLEGKNWAP